MALEIRSEARDNVVIIHLKGEMDSISVGRFEEEVRSAVEGGRCNLVVEISELFYLDSSGLGSIIRVLRTVAKYGGSLKITGMSLAIKALFDITRLNELVDMYPDLESALRGGK
jgi:anti-sigma B factor antagonist